MNSFLVGVLSCALESSSAREARPNSEGLASKWLERSDEAQALIVSTLAPEIITYVIDAADAAETWDILRKEFETLLATNLRALKDALISLTKRREETIRQLLARTQEMVNALNRYGKPVEEDDHVGYILRALPAEYSGLCKSLRYSGQRPTLAILSSALLTEEEDLLVSTEVEKEDQQAPFTTLQARERRRRNEETSRVSVGSVALQATRRQTAERRRSSSSNKVLRRRRTRRLL